jgi:hypothetical protein
LGAVQKISEKRKCHISNGLFSGIQLWVFEQDLAGVLVLFVSLGEHFHIEREALAWKAINLILAKHIDYPFHLKCPTVKDLGDVLF